MEFGLFNGGEDGEHNSVSLVEISKIFAMQDNVFHGAAPFDKEFKMDFMEDIRSEAIPVRECFFHLKIVGGGEQKMNTSQFI